MDDPKLPPEWGRVPKGMVGEVEAELVAEGRRDGLLRAAEMAEEYGKKCNEEWAASEVFQVAAILRAEAEEDGRGADPVEIDADGALGNPEGPESKVLREPKSERPPT